MNIIHFTHGKVNPEGGSGISRVVYALNKHEKLLGHNSKILSVVDGVNKHETYKRDEYVTIEMFPRIKIINRKNPIFNYIRKNAENIDVMHIHHMWFYDKNPIIDLCNELGIPTLMTLHDNYTKYMFNRKKKIAWRLFERKYANRVTAYRALCKEELYRIREMGIKKPIYINYNSISSKKIVEPECPEIINKNSDRLVLTNVSRINARKNQLAIIEAINMMDDDKKDKLWVLIIGSGDKKYIKKMKSKISEYHLEKNIVMLGPIYGDDKWNYIEHCDGYIQTSKTEGFSIAMAEAAVTGKPCILTRQCNVSYLYNYDFFIMCEPYADDISNAIKEFCESKDKWTEMSDNAYRFAKEELAHEVITNKMLSIYNEVIKNERF